MRLPGGVFGSTAIVLIFTVVAMTTVVWTIRTEWIGYLALILIAVIVSVFLWRMLNLADRHPEAALFTGSELLKYLEKSKYDPNIASNPDEYIEAHPIERIADKKLLMQPDSVDGEQLQFPLNEKDESGG